MRPSVSLLVFLARPPALEAAAFAARVVREVAGALARKGAACSVYVPDAALDAARHPFAKTASFDALVEIVEAVDVDEELRPEVVTEVAGEGARAYRVEERRLVKYARDWPDGQASPGLVLVSPVCRARGLDAAAFDAHWRERHGPLAIAHHVGMWDYRQAVVVETILGEPIDGVARLGFPSVSALETGLFDSREGRRAIGEDTARFVDVERTEVRVLREIVLTS